MLHLRSSGNEYEWAFWEVRGCFSIVCVFSSCSLAFSALALFVLVVDVGFFC